MRLLYKTSKFAIYDDVLTKDEFLYVYAYMQEESFAVPTDNGNWIKVWRNGDGSPVAGPPRFGSYGPFNMPLDIVQRKVEEAGKNHPEIVKPFQDMSIRPYLYPRGTKLSWHDDSNTYCGAATYYCHQKWGSTWGGELFVAEVPSLQQVFKNRNPTKPHIDHEWEDEYINIYGMGHFVTPKPNRLVVMAPGVYHSIGRVDPDAGDHPRCSIVAFYISENQKKKHEEAQAKQAAEPLVVPKKGGRKKKAETAAKPAPVTMTCGCG